MRITVQEAAFDAGAELAAFSTGRTDTGAIVTFTGLVRDTDDRTLVAMEIEHYPGMTERALTDIASRAQTRFDLIDALIIHRHGRLAPGDTIMMVATAAPHRQDAFDAAAYLMDFLKSRAPFWKREITTDGASEWVAARDTDEDALSRW